MTDAELEVVAEVVRELLGRFVVETVATLETEISHLRHELASLRRQTEAALAPRAP